MVTKIIEAIIAVFPVIGKIIDLITKKKPIIDEENEEKAKVDEEAAKNKIKERPSGDFWKDRHI